MIEPVYLPNELVSGTAQAYQIGRPSVQKITLEDIDEVQFLSVTPWTSINKHGHSNQWEVWVNLELKTAHVCLKGEEHELVNNSGTLRKFIAVKGHKDYTFDDLAVFFYNCGLSVTHGSIMISD